MRVVFLSLAMHALAFALVLRAPRRERAPEPAPLTPLEIVEVEEDESPPSSEQAGEATEPSRPSEGRIAMAAVRPAAVVVVDEGSTTVPSGTEAAPSPAPVWSGSFFTPGPNAMALGSANPFLPSKAAPEEEPEKKKKPDLGLRFGPSSDGLVLAVFKDVTSRSLAPLEGRARFTLRANAEGEVLGIDLDDATGGPGWDDARRLALEALRGKKIVVPTGARGVNVRFEVASDVSYPSGQRTKTELKFFPGGVILPDESNIGQVQTRKVHTRHIATEVL